MAGVNVRDGTGTSLLGVVAALASVVTARAKRAREVLRFMRLGWLGVLVAGVVWRMPRCPWVV